MHLSLTPLIVVWLYIQDEHKIPLTELAARLKTNVDTVRETTNCMLRSVNNWKALKAFKPPCSGSETVGREARG